MTGKERKAENDYNSEGQRQGQAGILLVYRKLFRAYPNELITRRNRRARRRPLKTRKEGQKMVEVTGYGVSPYREMYAENRKKAIDLHTDARDRLLAHFSREYCARVEGHYLDNCLREVGAELRQVGAGYPADEIWFSVHYAFDTLAYDWHIYTESDGRVRLTPDDLPGRHKVYERNMPVLCEVHRDEIRRGKARLRKKWKVLATESWPEEEK
jgi:hypothetical protein